MGDQDAEEARPEAAEGDPAGVGLAGQSWDSPSDTAKGAMAVAERTAKEALAEFNKLYAEDVAAFRQR